MTVETRGQYIKTFKKLFGDDVMHGAISDIKFKGTEKQITPINGTLLDIVQRSSLYELTSEQKIISC